MSDDAKRKAYEDEKRSFFFHSAPRCDHDFAGWREIDGGQGGEQVCTKCGMGAMEHTLRTGF